MAQQHFLNRRSAHIGARIRDMRKSRNLTQTELSEQIGVAQSDLSRMEKGEYRVGLDTLFKILGVFQLDMASFFDDVSGGDRETDRLVWEKFRGLSEGARREVRDFIEFKANQEEPENTVPQVKES